MSLWVVPVEAVRASASTDGAVILTKLAAEGARLEPNASVELTAKGYLATVLYGTPGSPSVRRAAHVLLLWAPRENAA